MLAGFLILWSFFVLFSFYKINQIPIESVKNYSAFKDCGKISTLNILQAICDNLLNISLLILLTFSFYSIGSFFLSFFKLKNINSLEHKIFGIGIGMIVISYLVFLLGILSILYKSILFIIVLLCPVALLIKRVKFYDNAAEEKLEYFEFLVLCIIAFFFLLDIIVSLSPETHYDSLAYHLTTPYLYLKEHKIYFIKDNFFANLPQNLEMLYVVALSIKDEILAKLIHFLYGVLIALSIYSFCKRYFNKKVAILAVGIFASTPLVNALSWVTMVDLGMTFFLFLSVYVFINSFFTDEKNNIILAGVLCGFTLGIKYTGFLFFLSIIVAFLLFKDMKNTVRFTIASLIFLMPLVIKNLVFTGNPVYPFFGEIFGGVLAPAKFLKEQMSSSISSFTEFLKLPWSITMNSSYPSGFIGPIFLIFLPFIFLKKFQKIVKLLFVFLILYSLISLPISTIIRFSLLIIVFLAILLAYSVSEVFGKYRRTKILLRVFILILFLINFIYVFYFCSECKDPFKVVFGLETKFSYLTRERPTYPNLSYEIFDYANRFLQKDSKILFIGETRTFYLKHNFVVSSAYEEPSFVRLIKTSKDENELYVNLKKEKITHIFENVREIKRLNIAYSTFILPEREMAIYIRFKKKYLSLIFSKDYLYLYSFK